MILKDNDLMIGDWVLYNHNVFVDDEYETPSEIVPAQIRNSEDMDFADEGCYSGLAISTEMLSNNGFVFNTPDYAVYNENDNFTVKYSFTTNMCYIKTDVNDIACKVIYCHELQHLMKLCKFKKEIYGGTIQSSN
jgi:hypothetical protein